MLVWMTLAAGIAVCLLATLAVVRVDRRWRRHHLRCSRCRSTWYGAQKFCDGCGAQGEIYDWRAEPHGAAHDRQGRPGTGPGPDVSDPGTAAPRQRPAVDYTDRVWSAPAATAPRPAPDRSDEVAGRR